MEGGEGLPCTWKRESCTPQPHPAALAHQWGAPHSGLEPLEGRWLQSWREQHLWHKHQTACQETRALGMVGPCDFTQGASNS